MRDDFDSVVADRFKVLDQLPVPDIWSRVQFKVLDHVPDADTWSPVQFTEEEAVALVDVKTTDPTENRNEGRRRVLLAGILAAAAVLAIAFVAIRDADDVTPVDEPSTTVTVPPSPPQALFGTLDVQLAPGTYFVDDVDGTPTPRIHVTVGAGWSRDGWGNYTGDGGQWMTFSRPDRVFLDACHPSDGFHPGPLTTLDGLVAALSEQGGWVDVTTPTDISIDGYAGKAFQRKTPAEFSDCSLPSASRFPSWENEDENGNKGWSYYPPGDSESLVVLDLDGTIIILETRVQKGQPAAAHSEIAAVLDSIRIERG
jgi:hypothetical protein